MPLAEYNDVTRMTRHQLAHRIEQMEATAARNSQLGAPNERHRPMEDRRRREKIALYRAELDRRIAADASQAAADARENAACECRFAGDQADASDCPTHGQNTGAPMNWNEPSQTEVHDHRLQTGYDPDVRHINSEWKRALRRDQNSDEYRDNPSDRAADREAWQHPRPGERPTPPPPPPAPRQWKHEADEQLNAELAKLLTEYTLGTLLDAAWDVARQTGA